MLFRSSNNNTSPLVRQPTTTQQEAQAQKRTTIRRRRDMRPRASRREWARRASLRPVSRIRVGRGIDFREVGRGSGEKGYDLEERMEVSMQQRYGDGAIKAASQLMYLMASTNEQYCKLAVCFAGTCGHRNVTREGTKGTKVPAVVTKHHRPSQRTGCTTLPDRGAAPKHPYPHMAQCCRLTGPWSQQERSMHQLPMSCWKLVSQLLLYESKRE